jgi:hypothetical protein
VSWSEEIDAILGGDLTAALTYLTPAGGAVATAVAPIGLRDREAGWVGFTTSLEFGKKLDRVERDPSRWPSTPASTGPPPVSASSWSRAGPRSSPTRTRTFSGWCGGGSRSSAPPSGVGCSGTDGCASTTPCGGRSRSRSGRADPNGTAAYAPHTAAGFVAPPNKTLLLLVNGLVAKLGVRSARRPAD